MKRLLSGVAAAVALVGGLVLYDAVRDKPGKLPGRVFDKMEFGDGFDAVTGDERGLVCHQVILRTSAGDELIVSHKLWHHDFRKMTPAEKRKVLREDAQRDMEDAGLACMGPDGKVLLHQAYAQPHCEDCGGGCGTKSCPATVIAGGGCMLGGVNCVITFICCSGPCTCG